MGVETGWLIGAAPAPDEPDPEVVVENVVGTELGRVDRYADEVEAFSALIEELGGHVFVGGSHAETADTDIDSERFEGEVARGLSADLDGETTDVRLSLVFDDAELVAPDEIADWTETNTFEAWKEVTVEEDEDDPALTVSGTVDTSEFTLSVPGGHDVDALVDW